MNLMKQNRKRVFTRSMVWGDILKSTCTVDPGDFSNWVCLQPFYMHPCRHIPLSPWALVCHLYNGKDDSLRFFCRPWASCYPLLDMLKGNEARQEELTESRKWYHMATHPNTKAEMYLDISMVYLPFPETTTLISMGDQSECQEPAQTGLSQSLLPPSKKQHEYSWII